MMRVQVTRGRGMIVMMVYLNDWRFHCPLANERVKQYQPSDDPLGDRRDDLCVHPNRVDANAMIVPSAPARK